MIKKILISLIVAATMLSLAACDKDETKAPADIQNGSEQASVKTDDSSIEEDEEIDYESDLSKEMYTGYNFRMYVPKGSEVFNLEEDSADIVNSAAFKRNKQVEEKYGIEITSIESAKGGYEFGALDTVLAGDDAYDIIITHSRSAFGYAVQGAAYNINDIEAIHIEKPWWSKDIYNSCSINGNLYVLDGDFTLGLGNAMCIFFNKNMFDNLGFDYPYEMVDDGDWTFDAFAYYAKKGGADLNGDGVIKPEDDQFGFVTTEWNAPINVLYAGSQKVYDKNDEGMLELTLYSNKTVDIFDSFFDLMDNEACFLHITDNSLKNYSGPGFFQSGRAMMAAGTIQEAKSYRNMDDAFGIIPYPKYDEDDRYTTAINGAAPLIVIPITVSDTERTGAILEALGAYSGRDVLPAFYEVSLKTKYSRDEESEKMMDLIKDSIIYDIGYVSGGTFQSTGRDLAVSGNRDFASYYASHETAAKTKLTGFNKDYAGFDIQD